MKIALPPPHVKAVVLDEADALLMTLGRYATFREKSSRVSHPKEAATLVSLLCAARGHELQAATRRFTVAGEGGWGVLARG